MDSGPPKPSAFLKILKASGIGGIGSKLTSSKLCTTNSLQFAKSMRCVNLQTKQREQKLPVPIQQVFFKYCVVTRRCRSSKNFKKRSDLSTGPVFTSKKNLPSKRSPVELSSLVKLSKSVPKIGIIPPYAKKDLVRRQKDLKAEENAGDYKRITKELNPLPREDELYKSELELKNKKLEAPKIEKQDMLSRYNKARKNLALLTSERKYLKESLDTVTENNLILSEELSYYKKLSEKQANENVELKLKSEELTRTIFNLNIERKRLHNDIQDLKGNIRVFCRVRPAVKSEKNKALINMVFVDENNLELSKSEATSLSSSVGGKARSTKLAFTFDQVFGPRTSQEELFLSVSPLVQSALDGYNVCIFAYGQTGSGKTFTMEGDDSNGGKGVIPRTVQQIFHSISSSEEYGWNYSATASFLEIYNEHIFDLLNSNRKQEEHEIKVTDSKGTNVYVTNLREEDILESSQLIYLMEQAQRNRATAATENNERSSRSHSVVRIKLVGTHQETKEVLKGSINLVDLAGSENPKNSSRMQETRSINKSLAELGKVILCLQNKQAHIPYRNSRLTFLLMPCLGGNSKTLMFVNVNPLGECYHETVNSLRFAQRVNQVKTAKIKRNKATEISNLSHF